MGKILKRYLAKADDPRFTEGYSIVSLRKPTKSTENKKTDLKTGKKRKKKK